ncbi:DegT/DnrJ/EryC1/StrS family aminotransferase [Candidatus Albibeggiatoa sp. nov. NOAA]|uniref:DegT/DnrJ/EryC1/StrS family aminotransferase n=1 Tax=Candidatus Albibeggiatoa sp. nov. NOAA TaxID=3162724 RepID=UPI0032F8B153|nr:DegT/DnrJ/EryC1/StrS family aminotransferase [Thiotrichaceae bacterium]
MLSRYAQNLYIPDMPSAQEILPWLQQIDENRWYTNFGKLNHEFETGLSQQLGKDVCVVTIANATLGLELALMALNLPKNAYVLIPSFTFAATATAVIRAGLCPLLADIDKNTWSLTPQLAYEAIQNHNIATVLPVSAFGYPQPVDQWDRFTQETNIPVLIDAAGAYGNQAIGHSASVVFSLHATKVLGIGEGGLFVTRQAEIAQQIRQMTNFGLNNCQVEMVGTNAKLSEYHATVGLAALKQWQQTSQHRKRLIQTYTHYLNQLSLPIIYQTPDIEKFIWSAFVLRFPLIQDVADVSKHLEQHGIETRRWYYPPLYQHAAFKHLAHSDDLPNVRTLSPQLLGLPFHHFLTEQDIVYICNSLKAYFQ